jgi:integrase
MRTNAASNKPVKGRGQFRLVRFANPSGAEVHRVTGWTLAGERVRQNFPTHAAAVARLQELEIEAANLEGAARPVVTRLTADQAAVAEAAFAQLGGKPLLDAVGFYLRHFKEPLKPGTVAEAFAEFIAQREAANLRPASLLNLRNMSRELLTLYGRRQLSDLLPDTLRPLVFKPTRSPVSADGYRRGIHAFLAWTVEVGYLRENPAAKIRPVKLERGEPKVLTVDECRRLLDAAATFKGGKLLPFVAVSLFSGLRPTEVARLTWDRIDLAEKVITVGADMAKLRGKRIVDLPDNLVEWLRPFATAKAPFVGPNHRKSFEAVREAAGLADWQQDTLRHTSLSMHLTAHGHEGQTARWGGNSPDVLLRHYHGLTKKGDAAAFWSLAPEGTARNVVRLEAAA